MHFNALVRGGMMDRGLDEPFILVRKRYELPDERIRLLANAIRRHGVARLDPGNYECSTIEAQLRTVAVEMPMKWYAVTTIQLQSLRSVV